MDNPEDDMATMRLQIERIQMEKSAVDKQNKLLSAELELMRAKLELTKQFLCKSVAVQTDILPCCGNSHSRAVNDSDLELPRDSDQESQDEQNSAEKQTKQREQIKCELDSFLDSVKAANQDYCYDAESNTYYSRSTGWYYYPENSAFYDPKNRSFYRYDSGTGEYTYLYSIDQNGDRVMPKSGKNSAKIESDEEEGELVEEEEGEIVESHSSNGQSTIGKTSLAMVHSARSIIGRPSKGCRNSISLTPALVHIESAPVLRKPIDPDQNYYCQQEDDDDEVDEDEDEFDERRQRTDCPRREYRGHSHIAPHNLKKLLNKVSPIRFIVQKSDSLDIGSLMLVTCLGGKVGQHNSCALTIPDTTVSQIHAEITYDKHRRAYNVQDLVSRNGTYINEEKLPRMQLSPLFHGDVVRFADCQLLAHIHQHRDVTCDECEPGTVMQKHAQQCQQAAQTNNSTTSASVSTHAGLKGLRKKYGLEADPFKEPDGAKLPAGYRNRAAKRQRDVGSDNPYEKTAAGSALDMPLDSRNKGFQMMSKMGWKTGQGLGDRDGTANTEPIDIEMRDHRRGLGFGHR